MTHDIRVNHVTRIEGHGNIVLNTRNGKIEELKLEIVESPRFFEMMLKDRKYDEAPHITSRICGICAVGHTTASLKAVEAAFDIVPSDQTILLRKIVLNAEIIQSHVLHYYFLVAPDFFGVGSVIPLAASHPDLVKRALRMKKTANDICEILVGRHVHPIAMVVNGFTKLPSMKELDKVRHLLEETIPDVEETTRLFQSLIMPDFKRKTEYFSLSGDDEYALYDGRLISTEGKSLETNRYKDVIIEHVVGHSTAKHVKSDQTSIMVGALARLNNNLEQLCPEAKAAADEFELKVPCYNPFMNNVAQIVETVHCIYESLRLLNSIASKGVREEKPEFKIRAGKGVGAVEAPRGTLYHEYEIDDNGIIKEANCIIPTAQNLANIEKDMEAFVPDILDLPTEEIRLKLEMLVRAYYPCISCSTHVLEVTLIE